MSILDNIKNLGKIITEGDELWNMAGHYFGQDNEHYDYPVPTLEKFPTIQKAEKLNQNRLLNSLIKTGTLRKKKTQSLVTTDFQDGPSSLSDMRDGEVFGLNDYYDADVNARKFPNEETDLKYSLGSFKMRSKSNLQFVKNKNKILPYGEVNHEISDIYDFHPETGFIGTLFKGFEDAGVAKSYSASAKWKKRPMGVINIDEDGNLDKSGVIWW